MDFAAAAQPRGELSVAELRSEMRNMFLALQGAAAASPRAMRRRLTLCALAIAGCAAFEPPVPPAAPPYPPTCVWTLCTVPTTNHGGSGVGDPGCTNGYYSGTGTEPGSDWGNENDAWCPLNCPSPQCLPYYCTCSLQPPAPPAPPPLPPQAPDASDYPVHVVMHFGRNAAWASCSFGPDYFESIREDVLDASMSGCASCTRYEADVTELGSPECIRFHIRYPPQLVPVGSSTRSAFFASAERELERKVWICADDAPAEPANSLSLSMDEPSLSPPSRSWPKTTMSTSVTEE